MTEGSQREKELGSEDGISFIWKSGWVGITCIVLFSTLALSQPLMGARPLAALRPPGTSEESGVSAGTPPVP